MLGAGITLRAGGVRAGNSAPVEASVAYVPRPVLLRKRPLGARMDGSGLRLCLVSAQGLLRCRRQLGLGGCWQLV